MCTQIDFPSLAPSDLKKVLEAIRSARPIPQTYLTRCTVYEKRLAISEARQSSPAATFILAQWLTDEIAHGLLYQRSLYRLQRPNIHSAVEQVIDELKQDFALGNPELEAWSVLYLRYVRTDLNLPWSCIVHFTYHTQRTLHRRLQRGLQRLVLWISAQEYQARSKAFGIPEQSDYAITNSYY